MSEFTIKNTPRTMVAIKIVRSIPLLDLYWVIEPPNVPERPPSFPWTNTNATISIEAITWAILLT